jgi:UDP-N-acetyl-D-mannosaminuronic acid dehydrogenase
MVSRLEDALEDAQVVVLLVAHTPLRELEPQTVAASTKSRMVVDIVNGWSDDAWEAQGFKVHRLGVGHEPRVASPLSA